MNKAIEIKKMLFAVLDILCICMFAKNTAYAVGNFSISNFSYTDNKDKDEMLCEVSVANSSVVALVYQVMDSDGKTVLIMTGKVAGGKSSANWNNIDLNAGEYTIVVSDFSGEYGSTEQKFTVEDSRLDCYMHLRGTDSVTAVIDLYIPEKYKQISIDGVDFNLANTTEYNENGVIFRKEEKDGMYTYMKDVPAKNFDDEIKIYVQEDDETELLGSEKKPMISFSVRNYLDSRLADKTNPDYEVCKAINDYGYAAQTFFGYYAPATPVTISDAGNLNAYKSSINGSCPGLKYIGSSLILDGTVAIRHYFSGNADGLEAIVSENGNGDDKRLQMVNVGDYCYVEIRNILATKLDVPFDLTVCQSSNSNNGSFRLSNYSVLTYCERVISNTDANPALVNIAKALVQYNRASKAFQGR